MRVNTCVGYSKDRSFAQARDKFAAQLGTLTEDAADRIVKDAREMLERPKSGKWYRNLPNRSSKGGEAPASQSGALSRSLGHAPEYGKGVHRRIGTRLWYGNHLIMKRNRPLTKPALDREVPHYLRELTALIGRSF